MDTISAASRNEPRVDVLSGPRSLLDEGDAKSLDPIR